VTDVQQAPHTPQTFGYGRRHPYDLWLESLEVPVHRGYAIEDSRTVEVGPWEERECNTAFVVLAGQEGVSEARITEIPPGVTTRPVKFTLDEVVYVVEGRGLTTIWAADGPKKTFEWSKRSIFLVPGGCTYQLSNTQGHEPARLLHYNYLPTSMLLRPEPEFYFDNPWVKPENLYASEGFSAARAMESPNARARALGRPMWYGNFFPDMAAWDKLDDYPERGGGGFHVTIQFASSTIPSHMSVFPPGTYKKAHYHGPGVLIVIPAGDGYSIMWPSTGGEKIIVPWREASVFVPPARWYHQHFNTGSIPARYLAFHAAHMGGGDPLRRNFGPSSNIEYPDEDPWIRQNFEAELAKRGLTSAMPAEAYTDRDYQWEYGDDD
jgi:oxalate decarboxylase/phosphoglucose isomerase-like protein (cupin superfamily)